MIEQFDGMKINDIWNMNISMNLEKEREVNDGNLVKKMVWRITHGDNLDMRLEVLKQSKPTEPTAIGQFC